MSSYALPPSHHTLLALKRHSSQAIIAAASLSGLSVLVVILAILVVRSQYSQRYATRRSPLFVDREGAVQSAPLQAPRARVSFAFGCRPHTVYWVNLEHKMGDRGRRLARHVLQPPRCVRELLVATAYTADGPPGGIKQTGNVAIAVWSVPPFYFLQPCLTTQLAPSGHS